MGSKLKKNVILVAIGSFSSKILVFLLVPLYTSVLSADEYGTIDLIYVTVSLLAPVFSGVIYEAMFRFLKDNKYHPQDVITVGGVVNLSGLAFILMLSPVLLLVPVLKELYGYIVLYYIVFVMRENIQYTLRGLEKMPLFSLSGVVSTVLTITLNIVFLIYLNMGIKGYLSAYILANSITFVLMVVLGKVYQYVTIPRKKHFQIFTEMMRYSLPFIPNAMSWWIANSSDKYILTMFHGTGMSGLYAVSYKIPSIANAVGTIFNSAWQTSAIDYYDSKEAEKKFGDIYETYFTFQIAMCSGLILGAKLISKVLFQKSFYEAWSFVPVLCVASFFHSMAEFLGSIYISTKKTKMIFYSTLAAVAVNVSLNFALIPSYAGLGAAVATLVSYLVIFAIRIINGRKIIRFPMRGLEMTVCILLMLVSMVSMCFELPMSYLVCCLCLVLILVIQRNSVGQLLRVMPLRKKR